MALVGRILVVLVAFLVASLAAGAVATFGYLAPGWDLAGGPPGLVDGIGILAVLAGFVIAGHMLLPAMLVIAIAEGFRLRSALLYAIAGGASGLISFYGDAPGMHPDPSDVGLALPREAEVVAAAGIVAGLVYWALAGRNAGRPRVADQARP